MATGCLLPRGNASRKDYWNYIAKALSQLFNFARVTAANFASAR
jgi:hypothetical protein